jgi:hypothetical protein
LFANQCSTRRLVRGLPANAAILCHHAFSYHISVKVLHRCFEQQTPLQHRCHRPQGSAAALEMRPLLQPPASGPPAWAPPLAPLAGRHCFWRRRQKPKPMRSCGLRQAPRVQQSTAAEMEVCQGCILHWTAFDPCSESPAMGSLSQSLRWFHLRCQQHDNGYSVPACDHSGCLYLCRG